MELYERIKLLATTNSLPHTVIFEGKNRYEASKFFAKCAVCIDEDKPCGKCRDCIKANKNVHPDIIELNPSGVMKNYPIDEIRRIKEDAYVLPNEAKIKVYIFNDVDNISVISQNALLKILEEPPKCAVFVLNCEGKAHLLDTIISRAAVFRCDLDEEQNNNNLDEAFNIIYTAINNDELELLIKITAFSSDREARLKIITDLQSALRLLYRIKLGVYKCQEYSELAEHLTINKIINAIVVTEEVRNSTLRNKAVKLTLTRFSAKLKMALGR